MYRSFDGTNYYLEQMNRDGSGRTRIVPYPIGNVFNISPDRRWITTVGIPNAGFGTHAVPIAGGAPQRICPCQLTWAPDGRFLYLFVQKPSRTDSGKTRVVPLQRGEMFPRLPPSGIPSADDAAQFPDSHLIDGYGIAPGPDPSIYAYVKTRMHRNLFRIPLH